MGSMLVNNQPRSVSNQGRTHYGFVVLGLVNLVVFSALGLARFGYTSILPAMQEALRLSNTQTGALQSWNLIGHLVTVVFSGILAARFGPRVVIGVGLLLVAVGMGLTGLVPTLGAACTGRFLAGVGGAGSNVPAMASFAPAFLLAGAVALSVGGGGSLFFLGRVAK
jgi:sugar phosphate permease